MKNYLNILLEELAKHGFGWTIGLLTANFVSNFFVIRSWKNLWGVATGRAAVSQTAMTALEFLIEGVFGFIAFVLVNKIVTNYWKKQNSNNQTAK